MKHIFKKSVNGVMPEVAIKLLNGEVFVHRWEWTTEEDFERLREIRIQNMLLNGQGRSIFEENEQKYTREYSLKRDLDKVWLEICTELANQHRMISHQVSLISVDGRIITTHLLYDEQFYTKEFERDPDRQVSVYELWIDDQFSECFVLFHPIQDLPHVAVTDLLQYFRLNDLSAPPKTIVWFNPGHSHISIPIVEVVFSGDDTHNFPYLHLWFDESNWEMTDLARSRLERLRERFR